MYNPYLKTNQTSSSLSFFIIIIHSLFELINYINPKDTLCQENLSKEKIKPEVVSQPPSSSHGSNLSKRLTRPACPQLRFAS